MVNELWDELNDYSERKRKDDFPVTDLEFITRTDVFRREFDVFIAGFIFSAVVLLVKYVKFMIKIV